MGRSRGGSRAGPRAAPMRRSAPPPQTVRQAAPPATVQPNGGGSMLGGLGSTIAQGMAFGTGSAIAHRAVDGIMGPRTVQHEGVDSGSSSSSNSPAITTVGADVCSNQMKSFQDCLNSSGNDIGQCQFYMDMLTQCRKAPSSSAMI